MKPAVWRLIVMAVLFALWIGYLVYLWQATLFFRPSNEPLILSRPQFLVADLVIVGKVEDTSSPDVKVEQVLFPEEKATVKPGETIRVMNLAECRPPHTGLTVSLDGLADPAKKSNVIEVVREITDLGLKEAKELVEGAPKNVKENIPKGEAEAIKKKLEDGGAKVSIRATQPDLTGPGSYLLPLRKTKKGDAYEVVPIPASPTYSDREGPPRIYPATPQTLAQYWEISLQR